MTLTLTLSLSVLDLISSSFPFLAPQSPQSYSVPWHTRFSLPPLTHSFSLLHDRASIKQWFCMTEQPSAQLLWLPNTHTHAHSHRESTIIQRYDSSFFGGDVLYYMFISLPCNISSLDLIMWNIYTLGMKSNANPLTRINRLWSKQMVIGGLCLVSVWLFSLLDCFYVRRWKQLNLLQNLLHLKFQICCIC